MNTTLQDQGYTFTIIMWNDTKSSANWTKKTTSVSVLAYGFIAKKNKSFKTHHLAYIFQAHAIFFFCICLANAIAITDLWCFLSLCIRIQHQLPILELKANELFPWILVVTKQHFLAMVSMIIKTHFLITIWVTISRIASLMAASISFFGDERSLYEVIWMNPSYSVRSPST
jgi:hypothetical protein